MAPSIKNGNHKHNLWVKHPDNKITEIKPGASIVPTPMTPGNYEIASVEIRHGPISHHPPGTTVHVTNVGQESLIFIASNDDYNFILPSEKSKELSAVEYHIYSIHRH